jgi:putative Mg2+ transporter-C (MgtC) family protein
MKHKPAGLRTNILICLGAALFTILSVLIGEGHSILVSEASVAGRVSDPARIAAQVVVGIGFLGGGMILQGGGGISGLTSAATVWIVAAIGMCIGLGYPIIASIFTVTVFFTLYVLSKVDRKLFGKVHCYESHIFLKSGDPQSRADVMDAFQYADLELSRLTVKELDNKTEISARYFCSDSRHLRVQAALWSVSDVVRVDEQMLV